MKKLILIICLSITGIIISGDKYPYISKHYPTESWIPQQSQENDPTKWGEEKFKEIATSCASLEYTFINFVYEVDPRINQWVILIDHSSTTAKKKRLKLSVSKKSPVDLLLEKRDFIKENAFTKKNIALIGKQIDILTDPLNLSEYDKKREIEFCQQFLLTSAEYSTEE